MLADPRGFCAGVEKAIKALAWMVRVFDPPVYCYHEIVHNRHVVDRFRAQGVIFVDDVTEVPPGAPLMLSAHGSAPEVVATARARGGVVVDAVCPLVTKVHHELKVRSRKGYTVLYVGHAGHEEAVGTMAVAPQAVRLLEREEDLDTLEGMAGSEAPVALLAQTTLSHDEWRGLMEAARTSLPRPMDAQPQRPVLRHHQPPGRPQGDRLGVRRRRGHRLRQLVQHRRPREGGPGRRLPAGAADQRSRRAPRRPEWHGGVTAGASAPEALVEAVIERLAPAEGVTEVTVTAEDEYFPPPPELRELLRAVGATLGFLAGPPGPTGRDPAGRDRAVTPRPRSSTCWPHEQAERDDDAMTFTRMDESTAEQWQHIIVESMEHQPRVAERVLAMLASLEDITDGFEVDQLVHSLQTATRAEEAGASDEVVVASLCHDIGKAVSVMNHPHIAAEILRSYVSDDTYHMIWAHQDFQGKHYYEYLGQDPNARDKYEGEPWYGLAEQFADEWDQTSFDPDYPTKPLSHFEPLVRQVFATPRSF